MLWRLHVCLFLACLTLTAGVAHGQSQPPPVRGVGYDPSSTFVQDPLLTNPGLVQELLPADRGVMWDFDSRLDRALHATSHGAFVRVEYLNTFIDEPGRGLLGAPIAGLADPREPFIVLTPSGSIVTARVEDLSAVRFDNINGIRTTMGVPLHFGSIEASYWGTEQETSTVTATDIPRTDPAQPVDAVATSVFTDGAPGATVILHDAGFTAPYSAQVWGLETNLFYNYQNPRLGLRVLPLIGIRFTDYDESLAQRGLFDNNSAAVAGEGLITPPLVRQLNSLVDNNLYAGQVGMRVEFAHQWMTIGAEPKVGLGVNHYEASVQTVDFRDSPFPPVVDDGVTVSRLSKHNASATFDLQTYANVHVNNWLNLRVGWTFSWLGEIARAHEVIYYNDLGTGNPPAISTKADSGNLWMSTFNVGGEIVLP